MNTYERIAQLIYESLSINEGGFQQYYRMWKKSKKNPEDKEFKAATHKKGLQFAERLKRRQQASGQSPEEYAKTIMRRETAGQEASARRRAERNK
jgi:hypothetical protein